MVKAKPGWRELARNLREDFHLTYGQIGIVMGDISKVAAYWLIRPDKHNKNVRTYPYKGKKNGKG